MNARQSHPIQIKAGPSDEGVFEGLCSPFGGEPDSWGDVVARGAYSESLKRQKAQGTRPALLWAHDQSEPIGAWLELKETDAGLYGRGKLTVATRRGSEAHALMKDRALALSVGFRTVKSEERPEGYRLLKQVDLVEISAVALPANPRARIMELKQQLFSSPRFFEDAARDALGLSAREVRRLAAGGWSALAGEDKTPDATDAQLAAFAARIAAASKSIRSQK